MTAMEKTAIRPTGTDPKAKTVRIRAATIVYTGAVDGVEVATGLLGEFYINEPDSEAVDHSHESVSEGVDHSQDRINVSFCARRFHSRVKWSFGA